MFGSHTHMSEAKTIPAATKMPDLHIDIFVAQQESNVGNPLSTNMDTPTTANNS